MRVLSSGPAELLAASRAIEDSGRPVVAPSHSHRPRLSTAHIRRHHEKKEVLTLADWLRYLQVPAVGAGGDWLERANGPLARLRLLQGIEGASWLS